MEHKYLTLAFTAIALCISSCSKTIDGITEPTEKKVVEVVTRSSSAASIEYPLTLYAFSSDGTLVESTTADDANDPLQMQLPVGDSYRLVALAGASGLTPVTTPTASTGIGIPTSGLITSPVQMGQADISTITTDVEANLTLSYQVAQLTVQLHNIPTDATAVNVTLSSLYSDLTYNGVPSGNKTVTVELSKSGSDATTWTASTVYTLPGVERSSLVVGINIITNNKLQNYSYTHSSTLQAGTPYSLVGTYDGEFNLTGTITPTGWNASQSITFTFGAGSPNNGGSTPDNNGNNGNTPSELPAALSVWNNHFVMAVTTNDAQTEAELLLLALRDWEVSMSEIETKIAGYQENELSGWRVPTEEELKHIATTLEESKTFNSVNNTLLSINGDKLVEKAYFCEDGGTRYVKMRDSSFFGNTLEDSAYRLRLVKTVTVSVQ